MKNKIGTLLLSIGIFSVAKAQNTTEVYPFSKDITTAIERDTVEWKYQTGAVRYSFIGDYKNTLIAWDKAIPKAGSKPTASDSLMLKSSDILDAKEYILKQSEKEQLIIINEAHHNPRHRTFTTSLLEGLYQNGYRFLGLEALSDTLINQRKYAVHESGFYTAEPEFGNLIYEALKLGFTVFGYEASAGKNGKEREIEQAENIKKFMKLHPDGKYLIHCGFDHVYENEVRNWEKAMAGRLKEFTGIDPLTIDQVKLSERSKPELNHYFLYATQEKHPFILKTQDYTIFNGFTEPKQTDVLVIHPVTHYQHNRPQWLSYNKKPYRISKKRLKKYSYPVQILAYRTAEYENDGIPADIIELQDVQNTAPLFLKKGSYTFVIKNQNYEVIDSFTSEI